MCLLLLIVFTNENIAILDESLQIPYLEMEETHENAS